MSNADTVNAIRDNIKTVVKSLGVLDNFREAMRNDESPKLGSPVYLVAYRGSEFETVHHERPTYDVANFDVIIRFMSGTLDNAFSEQADVIHGLRDALTVAALNIGTLAVSKLVSRVDTSRPDLEFTPPESRVTVPIKVRFRET